MPLGKYPDFKACVAANTDKDSPEGYCNAIEQRIKAGYTETIATTEAELTYGARADLPDDDFLVVVGSGAGKVRKLPINDETHMRNAWAVLHGARGGVILPDSINKDDLIAKLQAKMQSAGIKTTEQKVIFVVEALVTEGKLSGLLAFPRLSRNGRLYLPEDLALGDGLNIPVYLEHGWQKDPNTPPIGQVKLKYDPILQHLTYEGTVDKTKLPAGVTKWFSSIGAMPIRNEYFNQYQVPRLDRTSFFDVTLTQNAGMPEAFAIVENFVLTTDDIKNATVIDTTINPPVTVTPDAAVNPANGIAAPAEVLNNSANQKDKRQNKMAEINEAKITALEEQLSELTAKYKTTEQALNVITALEAQIKRLDPNYDHTTEKGHAIEACVTCYQKQVKTLTEQINANKPAATNVGETAGKNTFDVAVEVLANWAWQSIKGMGAPNGISVNVPFRSLPRIDHSQTNPYAAREAHLRSITESMAPVIESIATGDSGIGTGITEVSPVDIVPVQLTANLIDTVRVKMCDLGTASVRWQVFKELAVVALTQNTTPSEATSTPTSVDATPTPRGTYLGVSFEADKKVVGGITRGVAEAMRLAALNDVDNLILTAHTGYTTNDVFGGAAVSVGSIVATDTFTAPLMAKALQKVMALGYSPDNYIAVLAPKQFTDLLQSTDVKTQSIFNGDAYRTGIIPNVNGVEVRVSTQVPSAADGSGSITTYKAAFYKKNVSLGYGVSRDVAIETFRDIKPNTLFYKGHWDAIGARIQPISTARIVTA